jgi:hypothetical protein
MQTRIRFLSSFALACIFCLGSQTTGLAQGRGRGGGGGHGPGGSGMGNPGGGPPSGTGVDRGIGTSSDRSNGRADNGRSTASDRSNGRSDDGLDRARLSRENANRADEELRDHPDLPAKLHTTANDLREGYRAALATNPKLKFGQYVAANRVAANLGGTHPNITTSAILAGLGSGSSLGKTLQNLGLSNREAKGAEQQAEREIKEAKRRP